MYVDAAVYGDVHRDDDHDFDAAQRLLTGDGNGDECNMRKQPKEE